MDGIKIINLYEDILATTDKMLDAAKRNEWDTLIALERQCRELTQKLATNETELPLSYEHQQKKIEIIHQVLDHDAQIRQITEPWMTKLQEMISANRYKRNLQQTYQTSNAYL
ncbi:MAG: flagellar protein FliT [Nitrosomonas sp.]|nr:flagellar protein FliT [Burkholderiales bacterium]MCP5292451.1 flagellar protein FliT [Burkholderiales bacterium]MDR4520481.1 flagellar protein FliT [Nitrosomonas sp.]